MAELCRQYSPERVETICDIPRDQLESAARLLWEARPVAYYAWSGVEMHTNATQTARAIAQLCPDRQLRCARRQRRVYARSHRQCDRNGFDVRRAARQNLGMQARPLGPARWQYVTTDEVYRAILEQRPYRVSGLIGFGANLLLAHADAERGRQALAALDFYVHIDLFMNPTAELADIVLPVASAFEREALKIGFEVSQAAHAWVQLRPQMAEPQGEVRSDTQIVFELAQRLGLGAHFWDGDVEAAYRYQLGPSGVSLETLRQQPGGVSTAQATRYRKFAEPVNGYPRGFNTPTRQIELYSETLLNQGYPPLPEYTEPLVSPRSRPDLAEHYPLILTCAKNTLFCESQHRALPSLRRQSLEPEVELHPATAAERGISAGDWVVIETPVSRVKARARLDATLNPQVVCGQHGWWQAASSIGAPGYDPFSPDGTNFNLLIGNEAIDPVSGSVPHRSYVCQVRRG